jgi:cell division septum initiation protein DivIVA
MNQTPTPEPKRLTEAMVHQVMRQLDLEGVEPKYQAVRTRLGFGSNSTVVKFMRTYDPDQWDGPDEIPEAPENAASAIWETAYSHAWRLFDEKLSYAEKRLQEALAETNALADALDELQRTCDRIDGQLRIEQLNAQRATDAERAAREQAAELRGKLAAIEEQRKPDPTPDPTPQPTSPKPTRAQRKKTPKKTGQSQTPETESISR